MKLSLFSIVLLITFKIGSLLRLLLNHVSLGEDILHVHLLTSVLRTYSANFNDLLVALKIHVFLFKVCTNTRITSLKTHKRVCSLGALYIVGKSRVYFSKVIIDVDSGWPISLEQIE